MTSDAAEATLLAADVIALEQIAASQHRDIHMLTLMLSEVLDIAHQALAELAKRQR